MLLDSKDKERYKKEWNELKKNDFQNFFDNFYPSNRSLGQHEAVSFQFPTIQFGIRISKNETDFYQNEEKSTHQKFVTDKHDVEPVVFDAQIREKFENLLRVLAEKCTRGDGNGRGGGTNRGRARGGGTNRGGARGGGTNRGRGDRGRRGK